MAKILRVCNTEFLPPLSERDPNYVYFVYDKMAIYLGRFYYSDPFCIVEVMPEHPVEGMLYITIDGKLKSYLDYKVVEIGEIESEDQLQYLYEAGTIYFMKAEYRYLDTQTRTIQLPFQNGSYQLSVNLAKNIVIDKNTVIRFNPETNRFEIDGSMYGEPLDKAELIKELKGGETDSTFTTISNGNVRVHLKVSEAQDNLIKLLDSGIYASLDEYLTNDELEQIKSSLEYYQATLNRYLADLKNAVDESDVSVSEDSILRRIKVELDRYYPNINKIIEQYEQVYTYLQDLRQDSRQYTDKMFTDTRTEISKYIDDELRKMHPWEDYQSYLLTRAGQYKTYSYGGSYCKLYQASDSGAKFVPETELMNEVYVVNKGSKAAWVRIHIAVLEALLPNPKRPEAEENMVVIGSTAASLATGGWNWSTTMDREPGKYFSGSGVMNIYKARINEDKYVVYVLTYETALGANTKSLSAIRTVRLNTYDELEVGRINALIQTDQWEFPIVVESAAKSLGADPYTAFNKLFGAVGTYNPFNMNEHVDEFEPSEDEDNIHIEYSSISNKPSINGVPLALGTSLSDLGFREMSAGDVRYILNGGIMNTALSDLSEEDSSQTSEEDPSEYDYENFSNHPYINGVHLTGDITLSDLGFREFTEDEILAIIRGEYEAPEETDPSVPEEDEDDSIFNYRNMKNKPSLNGVMLVGNRSLEELGFRYLTASETLKIIGKTS